MAYMRFLILSVVLCLTTPLHAQSADSTGISFDIVVNDPESPVEVRADNLDIDRDTGRAVFIGNVRISHQDLRMAADRIEVIYSQTEQQVAQITASGNVVYVTTNEEAESNSATYTPPTGTLEMRGDVLVVQGSAAISGDSLTANLRTGEAVIAGDVSTIFGINR